MKIRVGCKTIEIEGYESIEEDLDNAFRLLYTSFFKDKLDITLLFDNHLPQFEKSGLDYIEKHPDSETTRKYFKNLRVIWREYFRRGRLQDAEFFLRRILHPIILEEPRRNFKFHKGPIYYFWGGTTLLRGELDKGFLLMHAAYNEEIRIKEPQPTPAFKFVSLNFSDRKQYFADLVFLYADYLKDFFTPYCQARRGHFNIDEFRKAFLEANPNPEIVFLFTHTLARIYQLSFVSKHILYSDFAGQYELDLLFNLVLVIENALRIKHPDYKKKTLLFPQLAEHLASSLSWNLKEGHLRGYIKTECVNMGFDNILGKLLDRVFSFKHAVSNKNLESDIAITYLVRNRGAHDVTASRIVVFRFKHLLQSLFNVLFLTAEKMYM
jgi:hypothetical protein